MYVFELCGGAQEPQQVSVLTSVKVNDAGEEITGPRSWTPSPPLLLPCIPPPASSSLSSSFVLAYLMPPPPSLPLSPPISELPPSLSSRAPLSAPIMNTSPWFFPTLLSFCSSLHFCLSGTTAALHTFQPVSA